MPDHAGEAAAWFYRPDPLPDADLRLYCFPHAGGGASSFRELSGLIGPGVEVAAVRLPGRESRFADPHYQSMDALVDGLLRALIADADRPFALLGHSFGALVAFECARRLAVQPPTSGRPRHLVVTGSAAPGRTHGAGGVGGVGGANGNEPRLHLLDDDALVTRLRTYGGMPAELLAQPALLGVLLPAVRGDLRVGELYRPEARALRGCLDIPVTALGAVDDQLVRPGELAAWSTLTSGPFDSEVLPGGHFFLTGATARTAAERVRRAVAARIPTHRDDR